MTLSDKVEIEVPLGSTKGYEVGALTVIFGALPWFPFYVPPTIGQSRVQARNFRVSRLGFRSVAPSSERDKPLKTPPKIGNAFDNADVQIIEDHCVVKQMSH